MPDNGNQDAFLARFFWLARFSRASFFSRSFFDIVSTMRSAPLIRLLGNGLEPVARALA